MDTKNPVVSVNKIKLQKPPHIDLVKHKVISLLTGINYLTGDILKVDSMARYMTLRGEILTTTLGSNGELVEKIKKVEVRNCNDMKNHESANITQVGFDDLGLDHYNGIFTNISVCADFESQDWYLGGSRSRLPYHRYRTRIYPCSLPDPSQCASVKELSMLQLGNIPLLRVADYSNKSQPLKNFINLDNFFYLDLISRTIDTSYFKENFIYDDDSDIIDSSFSHSYADVDKETFVVGSRLSAASYCTEVQIDSGRCGPYMDLVMRSSFYKMEIRRRYKKFFSSVSEIGGFADLIIYGLWSLYYLYNIWCYQNWVRSQLIEHFRILNKEEGQKLFKFVVQDPTKDKESGVKTSVGSKAELEKLILINSQTKILLLTLTRFKNIINNLMPQIILNKKIIKKQEQKLSSKGSDSLKNQLRKKVEPENHASTSKRDLFEGLENNCQPVEKTPLNLLITPQPPKHKQFPNKPSAMSKLQQSFGDQLSERRNLKKNHKIPFKKVCRKFQTNKRVRGGNQSTNNTLKLSFGKRRFLKQKSQNPKAKSGEIIQENNKQNRI